MKNEKKEKEEEGREANDMRAAEYVRRKEREEHERTHVPYRSWCKYCVWGRGRNKSHVKDKGKEEEENEVPRVSMDYFYANQADEDNGRHPWIVMIDEKTGEKYARALLQKGLGDRGEMDWLIKDMSDELKCRGHLGGTGGNLILK